MSEKRFAFDSSLITHHSSLLLVLVLLIAPACRSRQQITPQELASYAGRISFSNLKVGVSENMAKQTVYYLDGVVTNGGNRSVMELAVNATFRDIDGNVITQQQAQVITARRKPLAAGEARTMRLGFENIAPGWNQAPPSLDIVKLQLE